MSSSIILTHLQPSCATSASRSGTGIGGPCRHRPADPQNSAAAGAAHGEVVEDPIGAGAEADTSLVGAVYDGSIVTDSDFDDLWQPPLADPELGPAMQDDELEAGPKPKRAVKRRAHIATCSYGCDYCTKRFVRQSDLVRHLRTHTGEKPFGCKSCPKRFIQMSALTVHTRTHTGEKPFSCSICKRRFSDSSSLARHIKSHAGDRPHICVHELCDKAFARRVTLLKHQLREHGIHAFKEDGSVYRSLAKTAFRARRTRRAASSAAPEAPATTYEADLAEPAHEQEPEPELEPRPEPVVKTEALADELPVAGPEPAPAQVPDSPETPVFSFGLSSSSTPWLHISVDPNAQPSGIVESAMQWSAQQAETHSYPPSASAGSDGSTGVDSTGHLYAESGSQSSSVMQAEPHPQIAYASPYAYQLQEEPAYAVPLSSTSSHFSSYSSTLNSPNTPYSAQYQQGACPDLVSTESRNGWTTQGDLDEYARRLSTTSYAHSQPVMLSSSFIASPPQLLHSVHLWPHPSDAAVVKHLHPLVRRHSATSPAPSQVGGLHTSFNSSFTAPPTPSHASVFQPTSGTIGLGISFGGHMELAQQDVYQQPPTSSAMYYAPAAHYL